MKSELAEKLLAIEQELNTVFVERHEAIRGIIISAISRTNILFLGSAGIGKSALINQWNKRIVNGRYFSWLLTKFTTPEEIFGPPSIHGLENEKHYRVLRNKLADPETTTAFLDETFKGNSSILNSLLTVLNERIFYNDGLPVPLNLVTVAGASNEIPEAEDGLDAFFDRFLLKFHLKPIQESSNFVKMLKSNALNEPPVNTITLDELKQAQVEREQIIIPEIIYGHLVKLRESLRKEGISVTDRTFKISLGVIQAEAWLNGHNEVLSTDLEIFKHICWTKPDQEKNVHGLILELISPEKNKIITFYNDCQDVAKGVYKHKDAVKKQAALVDANKKIREARTEIGRLKKDMLYKKQDIAEIEKMEVDLERLTITMAQDILGLNLTEVRTVL